MRVDDEFAEQYDPGQNRLPDFKLLDTRVETARFGVSANFATFTGWSPTVTKEWGRIDFVLAGNNGGWYVGLIYLEMKEAKQRLHLRESTSCKVGAGMSDDGMMHSDHRPAFVDFDI